MYNIFDYNGWFIYRYTDFRITLEKNSFTISFIYIRMLFVTKYNKINTKYINGL